MEFKYEKDRQKYYQNLRQKNNAVAQKNNDLITEAYQEVEFGVVSEIQDTRSLAEQLADERKNQEKAQYNALQLMKNDATESTQLLTMIGTARYKDFNKYYLDIYDAVKGKIGYYRAPEMFNFIEKFIQKSNITGGVDIPNVELLNSLINEIQNVYGSMPEQFADIILRLQALENVLSLGVGSIDPQEYASRNLPTKQDVDDIVEILSDTDPKPDIVYKELSQMTTDIGPENLGEIIVEVKEDDNIVDDDQKKNELDDDGMIIDNGGEKIINQDLLNSFITATKEKKTNEDKYKYFYKHYEIVSKANVDSITTDFLKVKESYIILLKLSGQSNSVAKVTTASTLAGYINLKLPIIEELKEMIDIISKDPNMDLKFEDNDPTNVKEIANKRFQDIVDGTAKFKSTVTDINKKEALKNTPFNTHYEIETLQDAKDKFIEYLQSCRGTLRLEDKSTTLYKSEMFYNYIYIYYIAYGKDPTQSAKKQQIQNLGLSGPPYTIIYNYLTNEKNITNPQEPSFSEESKIADKPKKIGTMQDLVERQPVEQNEAQDNTATMGAPMGGSGFRNRRRKLV